MSEQPNVWPASRATRGRGVCRHRGGLTADAEAPPEGRRPSILSHTTIDARGAGAGISVRELERSPG
jgi:hypothetical protein